MGAVENVLRAMISYYAGDARRVNHFLKVYGFAKAIGSAEGLDGDTQETLEIAALTHDIGIKNSEVKYGDASGPHQQVEGPPEARRMLEALALDRGVIDRVCWLIAHHHTYENIEGMDYQILIEADFLVNIYEDQTSAEDIDSIRKNIFRTQSGLEILDSLYRLARQRGGESN